jgi:trigger factor
MKAVVEDIGTLKKKISIEVSPEAVDKELARAIAEISKTAKIPGFRPGKAPKAVVEKHYGDEVRSEVMQRLVSDHYLLTLEQNNLNPVDVPQISDVSPLAKGAPLTFVATVEVRPVIELGSYDGIEVKEQSLEVTDAELNETLDRLREMYAQLEVVEGRPLDKTDTAVIDFEGFDESGKSIEGAKATDHMLALGENSLIPGFEEQLVGMNKGETRKIKVTFPKDYSSAALAGKDADFTVTLKEIKKKVLPELNDDFAKDIGGDKSLDELKAGIKKDLELRKRDEQASAQREELLSKLIDSHTFDVPPGMVERELQAMMRKQATRMARQGMDVKSFDAAKFIEEHKVLSEQRVKGVLILDTIADKEKVEIGEAEITSAIAAMARSSKQPVEAIRKYYDSVDGGLDNLRSSLVQEKTLNLLLSRAKKSYN